MRAVPGLYHLSEPPAVGLPDAEVLVADQTAQLRLEVGRMLDQDIGASELDGTATAVAQHQLDRIRAGVALDQPAQLLQHAQAGVVVPIAEHLNAQHASSRFTLTLTLSLPPGRFPGLAISPS